MAFVTLPFLDDNYELRLLAHRQGVGDCALVDPAAPYALLDVGREVTLRYRNGHTYIWTTPKHFSHAGGNKILDTSSSPSSPRGTQTGACSLRIETLQCDTIGHLGYHVTAPGKSKDEGCLCG
ncbi:hypothetical protein SPRG_09715 [Saprolegnia parasitica CBS 223.65]|uniref:Uncharacterized protein n=1 Tax=Saprolegnia parasitica (strain CBS 223.65) TaxID=695850 RepID=A0A067C742_SAPPC|nr:hypothetical protein SPRG_09715 [Saprolegnia parasitica CBS 223.65]KDO24985.1 hypothetical protein SPRG_09715 [Saprolegnia parasitica CBS 223.65]|eukprot:XP_012204254.1 hypothetical protein SPRG_09715 [Saprolegnia parasitica CBS 223.65]